MERINIEFFGEEGEWRTSSHNNYGKYLDEKEADLLSYLEQQMKKYPDLYKQFRITYQTKEGE